VPLAHACSLCSFLLKWGTSGSGNSQFIFPFGVAVDCSGNVYVADYNRVQLFGDAVLRFWVA
jgi:DNA-binding beta-propeller fold protein YncE